jgi:hypothetical protein
LSYVNGIAEKLSVLGVSDPAVTELWKAVNGHAQLPHQQNKKTII